MGILSFCLIVFGLLLIGATFLLGDYAGTPEDAEANRILWIIGSISSALGVLCVVYYHKNK